MIQDLGDLTKSAGLLVEYDRGTRGLVFMNGLGLDCSCDRGT